MKKVLSLLVVLLATLVSQAENLFSIDAFDIKPGDERTLVVNLTTDIAVKGISVDISLPEGLAFAEGNGEVAFNDRVSGFMLKSANIQSSGALRVAIAVGMTLGAGSGEIFTFKIKANEDATLGKKEINLINSSVNNETNAKVGIADKAIDVNIYALFNIQVAANYSAMGSVQGGGEIKSNTETTVKATASEGYHFVKWTDGTNDVSTNVEYTFTVTAAISLTAVFAPNQYTMTFVLGNGQENVVKTQDYKSVLTAPNGLTKTGYTFAGWNPEVPATVPIGDQTFTAQWTINQYTITFDTDGGSEIAPITQDYNTAVTAPANPTRTGYTFDGWDKEIPASMPAENVTVKAKWTIITYTLSYDLAGGSLAVGDVNAETYTIASEAFTLKNPVREGYTFAGWTGTGLTEATQTVTIAKGSTGNRSYTATWTINQYDMTFKLENGEEDVVKHQDYASTLTAPVPTREGYTLAGWTPEVPATVPASNQTFTAQWTINQYTVTFDTDGGTAVDAITQDYNTAITAPANPTKTGYTFAGWDKAIPATMPAENLTIKAQWTINQYTITFDTDGGTAVDAMTQDYNTAITAPANPTKTGHTFAGWDKAIPTTMPAENLTIKAQWTINKYKVSFKDADGSILLAEAEYDYNSDLTSVTPNMDGKTNIDGAPFSTWDNDYNGKVPANDVVYTAIYGGKFDLAFVVDGTTVKSEEQVEYNSDITAPEDPTKEGHTFAGWKDQTEKYFTEYNGKMPAKNVTFNAQWTVNQYTVTFKLNNGSDDVVSTQDYQSDIIAPADPEKEGHTFTGWNPEVDAKVPANNVTYDAVYEVNTYQVTWIVDGQTTVQEIEYGKAVTPVEAEKEGYTFTGWDANVPGTMPANNLTFTAQFTINQYTVTFMVGDEVLSTTTANYGTVITVPDNSLIPDKEGWVYEGWWNTDPEATEGIEVSTTVPAQDITYYAIYRPDKCTITWVVDGVETKEELQCGSPITKPADPEKEGYTFTGWTPEIPELMPSENVTYTAVFTVNQYKVTFIANGYTVSEEMLDYGTPIVAPDAPSKEGYSFIEWTPAVDATVPAHDVTYKAAYQLNIYTVIYIVDGEEWKRDYLAYGAPIELREYTPDEGYTFMGWYSDEEYETMPAHDVTYTGTCSKTTDIDAIIGEAVSVDIYDIRGRLIYRNMPTEQIRKRLPAGVYIIQGRKIVLK